MVVICILYDNFNGRSPQAPAPIFQGIAYGCERLPSTSEGRGLVHWATIDLSSPGLELFVTPTDPTAIENGWQYRLRRTEEVVATEGLSVAINATLFETESRWLRLPGSFAKSVETVVADHHVSHIWEHTYLLWFDDQLMPHLKPSKPPTEAELALARWAIGGQAVGLLNGVVRPGASLVPDSRTAIAIDANRRLLFLAAGESISPNLLLGFLQKLGAKDGMLLDGGGSTCMAIGQDAVGVRPGALLGGWRPVATHFGVRARRHEPSK